MWLFSKSLDEKAVLSLINILTFFDYSEHCFKHLNILMINLYHFLLQKVYLELDAIWICIIFGTFIVPIFWFQWRTIKYVDRWSSESQEPGFPVLPRLVVVDDPLGHPGHEADLVCTRERPVELGRLVRVLEADVVADQLGHLRQQGRVLVVDHSGAAAVHTSHLKCIGPQFVRTKNISVKSRYQLENGVMIRLPTNTLSCRTSIMEL